MAKHRLDNYDVDAVTVNELDPNASNAPTARETFAALAVLILFLAVVVALIAVIQAVV